MDSEPPSGPLLTLDEVTFSYRERPVLNGLSFDVKPGEVFGLLGPNGSGKSTALALIAGLRRPSGGRIDLRGRPLDSRSRAFRSELGVVFQHPSLDPNLTARENLGLAARLHGMSRAAAKRRAAEELERARLTGRADDLVSTFSGGMKRRLDLGRALLHEPTILLMDEPTAGLDEAAFRGTWELLASRREEREITVVVATHRPDEAAQCTRLAVIERGRAERIATPAQLRAAVSGDVITIETTHHDEVACAIREETDLDVGERGGHLVVECERGHEWIPRIVKAAGADRIDGISMRHPSLADAFLKITGHTLDEDDSAPAEEAA